ncbi:hypothetical protein [Marinilactibacillus psychrotolerans]|uniref:hypothetical protein n=1 Tax=Marinilactibacillus psychrotolerans TaxID=191770 RepID=UPI00382F3936
MNYSGEIFKLLEKLLDHLYKKGNLQKFNLTAIINRINKLMVILNNNHLFYPKQSVDKFGIDIANISLNPKESNKINTDKSLGIQNSKTSEKNFKRLQNEFRQKLVTFYENMSALLIEKITKENKLSQKARISYINLMDACDLLPKMVKRYNQEFPLASNPLLTKEQIQNFRLLSTVWSYLFLNDLRKDRSILFSRKEYLKRYLRKISTFFEKKISKINGVIAFQKIDSHYELTVDILQNNNVLEDLILLFRKEFPEIEVYTLENSLWTNEFDFVEIRQRLLAHDIPPIYQITSEKFAYIKVNDIDKKIMAFTSSKSIEIRNELLKNFLSYQASIAHMTFIYNHLMSVYENIYPIYEKIGFNKGIYSQWSGKTKNLILTVIHQISETTIEVNRLLEETFGKNLESDKAVAAINKNCNELEKTIQVAMALDSISDYQVNMSNVEYNLSTLKTKIQYFTAQNESKYETYLEENL